MNGTQCAIPTVMVGVSYIIDPDTEDVIFGDELENDMVVMLDEAILRGDPELIEAAGPYELQRTLETARWCRVDKLHKPDSQGVLRFIGVYADGTKRSRAYGSGYGWIVKKASVLR